MYKLYNAYQKAVFQLRKYPNEITKGEQVKDIDGIGAKLVGKIDEIIDKIKSEGMEIYDISTDEGDLEDVFIDVTKS